MKKYSLVIFALFMLIQNSIIRPQTGNQALIFSIDVSKSMLQPPGFYNSLKENIKTFIKNDVRLNDLVTIYSFGDDVKIISDAVNFHVKESQDIEKLIQFIDKLSPTDNKTFLTKAIDITANQMESLQKQYNNLPITAYIFTDGKNDPPTGSSTLSLAEILSKHNKTFKNLYTYTYIVTLGTRLDSELQSEVDRPGSNIKTVTETKDLNKRSVIFNPKDQKILINDSNRNNLTAKFKFFSIKNIEKGTLKFTRIAESTEQSLQRDVNFDKNSSGKNFEIPIDLVNYNGEKKREIKYAIIPVNDNYEVAPKEVNVLIEVEEGLIEILTDSIKISISENGDSETLKIKGINRANREVTVLLSISPANQNVVIENQQLTLPVGEFEEEVTLNIKSIPVGNYLYAITLQPIDGETKIDKAIPLIINVERPFNWSPIIAIIIIVVLLGALAALAFLFFFLIDKEFAKYTVSGMGLKKEPLNNFKKFYKTKIIIGSDLFSDIGESVVTIKANLKTPFNKKLILDWHGNEENTSPKDVLSYTSLNDMQVQFNKKFQFAIEKIL